MRSFSRQRDHSPRDVFGDGGLSCLQRVSPWCWHVYDKEVPRISKNFLESVQISWLKTVGTIGVHARLIRFDSIGIFEIVLRKEEVQKLVLLSCWWRSGNIPITKLQHEGHLPITVGSVFLFSYIHVRSFIDVITSMVSNCGPLFVTSSQGTDCIPRPCFFNIFCSYVYSNFPTISVSNDDQGPW